MYKIIFEVEDSMDREELIKMFEDVINDKHTMAFSIKQGVSEEKFEELIKDKTKEIAVSVGSTVERLNQKFVKVAKQMVKNGYYVEREKGRKGESEDNDGAEDNVDTE